MNRESTRSDAVAAQGRYSNLEVACAVYVLAAGTASVAMMASELFSQTPLSTAYEWGTSLLVVCLWMVVLGAAVRVVRERSSSTARLTFGVAATVLMAALAALDFLSWAVIGFVLHFQF